MSVSPLASTKVTTVATASPAAAATAVASPPLTGVAAARAFAKQNEEATAAAAKANSSRVPAQGGAKIAARANPINSKIAALGSLIPGAKPPGAAAAPKANAGSAKPKSPAAGAGDVNKKVDASKELGNVDKAGRAANKAAFAARFAVIAQARANGEQAAPAAAAMAIIVEDGPDAPPAPGAPEAPSAPGAPDAPDAPPSPAAPVHHQHISPFVPSAAPSPFDLPPAGGRIAGSGREGGRLLVPAPAKRDWKMVALIVAAVAAFLCLGGIALAFTGLLSLGILACVVAATATITAISVIAALILHAREKQAQAIAAAP